MPSQRRSSYKFAFSGAGGVQADFDTPMPDASLDTAWDVSSDTLPGVEDEVDRILDCTQQDLVALELLRRVMRWSVDFQADPVMLAIAVAYIESVAGTPTGTPRNQRQDIVIAGATSGTFRARMLIGAYIKETPPIPFAPTIADVKRAVESLTAVGRGNTVVTNPVAGTFRVEMAGNLARASMPVMTANIAGLNGGASVTITENQTAIQRAHAISRIAGYQPVAFNVMTGSTTSTRPRRKWTAVGDSLRIGGGRATPRLTASLGVAGSADVRYADPSYVLPACQIYRAARFLDGDLILDGVSYQDSNLWRSFELRRANGLIVDEDAQTSRDEDIHRAERADARTLAVDLSILGEEGDDIYEMAFYRQEVAGSLRIGRSGRNLFLNVPKGVLSLRNPAIVPDGTARRSAIQLSYEPELIPGDASTPYTWTANVENSATLLTPMS